MDMIVETKKFLEEIHNPAKREESINHMIYGVVFGEKNKDEDVGKVASFLLTAIQEERDLKSKNAIFCILAEAVEFFNIEEYIDWDVVIGQLPLLLSVSGLERAFDVLYRAEKRLDISMLKRYLDHPSIIIRMQALDVICHNWLVTSNPDNRDPRIRTIQESPHYRYIQARINNPKRRYPSDAELEEQFLKLRDGIMIRINEWLEIYG